MASKIAVVEAHVRYLSGAYVTCTVLGQRCSCTHSAEEAAKRLGKKIFGAGFLHVEEVEAAVAEAGKSSWRIHGQEAA